MAVQQLAVSEEALAGTYYPRWSNDVKNFVYEKAFVHMQFINSMVLVQFGSVAQRAACKDVGVPDQYAEDFWSVVGCSSYEEAVRRKRSTLYNALNVAFRKYCEKPPVNEEGDKVKPPDPKMFIPVDMDSQRFPVVLAVAPNNSDGSSGTEQEADAQEGQDLEEDEFDEVKIQRWSRTGLGEGVGKEEYARFWAEFVSVFVERDAGGRGQRRYGRSHWELLSEYVEVPMESFAVLLYMNNYDKFMNEYWKWGNEDSATLTSGLTAATPSSAGVPSRFTDCSRGTGKYSGWSDEAMVLYNLVFAVLERQRLALGSRKSFDERVKKLVQRKDLGKSKRKFAGRVEVRNGMSKLMRLMDVGV